MSLIIIHSRPAPGPFLVSNEIEAFNISSTTILRGFCSQRHFAGQFEGFWKFKSRSQGFKHVLLIPRFNFRYSIAHKSQRELTEFVMQVMQLSPCNANSGKFQIWLVLWDTRGSFAPPFRCFLSVFSIPSWRHDVGLHLWEIIVQNDGVKHVF